MQGLEVYNDSQTLQIGTTPVGFGLLEKRVQYSVLGQFAPLGYSMQTWSVTVTGVNPICAFACSTNGVLYNGCSISGNQFTFYFASRTAPANTACTFYIFDAVKNVSVNENLGLETFDGSGTRIFHSGARPLKARTDSTQQAAYFGGFGWSWNMFQGHAIYSATDVQIVGNQITHTSQVYHYWDVYQPPYFGNGAGGTGPGFFIDVTNY